MKMLVHRHLRIFWCCCHPLTCFSLLTVDVVSSFYYDHWCYWDLLIIFIVLFYQNVYPIVIIMFDLQHIILNIFFEVSKMKVLYHHRMSILVAILGLIFAVDDGCCVIVCRGNLMLLVSSFMISFLWLNSQ